MKSDKVFNGYKKHYSSLKIVDSKTLTILFKRLHITIHNVEFDFECAELVSSVWLCSKQPQPHSGIRQFSKTKGRVKPLEGESFFK